MKMTGLDLSDRIIEAACVITDAELNIIDKCGPIVINQPKHIMDEMNEWCRTHHEESGLTSRVLQSDVTSIQAEETLLSFVKKYSKYKTGILAGNSVHVDLRFLLKEMPRFVDHLHYRIIDVSSIKELVKRWYPLQFKVMPEKKLTHRAMDDIQESIEELRYYRQHIFK